MEFDKSRVYTAVNADELRIGSEVYVADTLECLMFQVTGQITPNNHHSQSRYYNKGKIVRIEPTDYTNRFKIEGDCRTFNLAYLISEPEEKHLEWTDLKIGDVVRNGIRTYMVVGIDSSGKWGSHIYCGSDWITDDELKDWEKVE